MLSDWQNWQKLHTCTSITSGQCIYCKCVKALRRQVCTAAKENKPPVSQSTCSIHDCSGAASVHCPADKLRVHSLKEQCEPLLCPTHYQQCVGHATCAWCKSRLTPEHRWKSPNFQLAEHVLRSMHHVRISDESRFCRRCYQKQIDMLPADNAPSTDHQLRSIISQYSTEGAESDFPNIIVIAATGRELLDKDAIVMTRPQGSVKSLRCEQHQIGPPRSVSKTQNPKCTIYARHHSTAHQEFRFQGHTL